MMTLSSHCIAFSYTLIDRLRLPVGIAMDGQPKHGHSHLPNHSDLAAAINIELTTNGGIVPRDAHETDEVATTVPHP
jgi:hypothetical protein